MEGLRSLATLPWRDPAPILRPRDVKTLLTAMIALSRLAADQGNRLVSIEVNPPLVHEDGRGVTAVDARMVLS